MFCICFRGYSQDYIDSSTYYHNLGVEVLLKGNPQLALISLNKANSLNPNNEFTLYNMGVCYHELKDYKKALRFYKKANKLDPGYLSAVNGIAKSYQALGKQKQAKKYYLKEIYSSANNWETLYNIGLIYYEEKNYVEANVYFSKANSLNPTENKVLVYLGNIRYTYKEYDKALYLFNEALTNDNMDVMAIYNSGLCYLAMGDVNQACLKFKEAESLGYKIEDKINKLCKK
jgi:tetratricopeptide (TPR) repeat protein